MVAFLGVAEKHLNSTFVQTEGAQVALSAQFITLEIDARLNTERGKNICKIRMAVK